MAIKVIGLGPKLYLSDSFNIFDGLVTLVGLAELIIDLLPGSVSSRALKGKEYGAGGIAARVAEWEEGRM
jgi:hypothetical protein